MNVSRYSFTVLGKSMRCSSKIPSLLRNPIVLNIQFNRLYCIHMWKALSTIGRLLLCDSSLFIDNSTY